MLVQDLAESDLGIAAAAEGWPVLGDRSVIIDSAALGEQVDGSGDHTFAVPEAHEQCLRRRVAGCWRRRGQTRGPDPAVHRGSGNLKAAFDITLNEIGHHGLHGGNDGEHGFS